jgi:hypothetical protein
LYASYFCLGILGFHKGWFISNGTHRFLPVWLFSMFILAVGIIIFKATLPVPSSVVSKFLYALLHSFLCLSVFVVLTDIFRRNFNKPSNMKQQLSLNAYGIYLIHMNFVVLFQFVFHNFILFSFLKFALVSILGFLMSYIICEYGLRRAPLLRKVLY